MGDLSPQTRTITVGGQERAFPKLVAAKSIVIKDLLANKIIEFVGIRAKGRPPEIDEVDKEFDPKISELEEEWAFESDEKKKAALLVKVEAMKRQKLFRKVEVREAAEQQVEAETFVFVRDVLFENALKVVAIAMGSFDQSGALVPVPERELAQNMTMEEMAQAVDYVMDDIVATKKKLNGIGDKLRELLAAK